MAFSDDGKTIAAGTAQGKAIFLWEADTGKLIRAFEAHKEGIVSIAFAPGGKMLASGSQDGVVKLWEVPSGKELKTLDAHKGDTDAVIVAGKELVTGGVDGLVRFWNTDDDRSRVKLWHVGLGAQLESIAVGPPHGLINSLAFFPGGRRLVTGNGDGTLSILELAVGE